MSAQEPKGGSHDQSGMARVSGTLEVGYGGGRTVAPSATARSEGKGEGECAKREGRWQAHPKSMASVSPDGERAATWHDHESAVCNTPSRGCYRRSLQQREMPVAPFWALAHPMSRPLPPLPTRPSLQRAGQPPLRDCQRNIPSTQVGRRIIHRNRIPG